MIISRTPIRITFLGGGTDYPNYYMKNSGETVGMAINKYSTIVVDDVPEFSDHKFQISYSKTESVDKIDEIKHPAIKACLDYLDIKTVQIHYTGTVPARTGLGSSSSFTVGLLNALFKYKGYDVGQEELAKKAIYVEQEIIGERVGCQDQYTCALGGLVNIRYGRDGIINHTKLAVDERQLQLILSNIMVYYTGIQRYSTVVLGEQMKRTDEGKNDSYLSSLMDLIPYLKASFEGREDVDNIGHLLHQGWLLKKSFSRTYSDGEGVAGGSKVVPSISLGIVMYLSCNNMSTL